jgi:hypothetical protein
VSHSKKDSVRRMLHAAECAFLRVYGWTEDPDGWREPVGRRTYRRVLTHGHAVNSEKAYSRLEPPSGAFPEWYEARIFTSEDLQAWETGRARGLRFRRLERESRSDRPGEPEHDPDHGP